MRSAASLRWLVLILVSVSSFAAGSARAEMEVYHPKYRVAEDLVPMVEAVIGPEGRIAVDGHSGAMVLVGPAEAIAQALELLAIQDRKLRTVLIEHETRTASDLDATGARITWSAGGNSFRVGNVVRPGGGSGASVTLGDRHRRGSGSQVGVVRVLEGEWGRIARGSEVVLPTGSFRYPDAVRVAAESGLEVRPRILGDGRVRLDLRPFQARLGRGAVVHRSSADTTLVVAPGETAVVGGIGGVETMRSGSAVSGGVQRSGSADRLLLVTVTVDGEPAGNGR